MARAHAQKLGAGIMPMQVRFWMLAGRNTACQSQRLLWREARLRLGAWGEGGAPRQEVHQSGAWALTRASH